MNTDTPKKAYTRKWHKNNPTYAKNWRFENKERCADYRRQWKADHPEMRLIISARNRAKMQGLPCTLVVEDIAIPEVCPVFGIPLVTSRGRPTDSSPSLDKLVPELGYVSGNVQVISMKANRLKSDGTAEEHAAIAEYMRNHSAKR